MNYFGNGTEWKMKQAIFYNKLIKIVPQGS